MANHGYLKFNYGNDTYFPDTALKRYTRFHESGSTWIFNTCFGDSYGNQGSCGCGCGCGSNWGLSWGSNWGWNSFSKRLLGFGAGALATGLVIKGVQWFCNDGWDTVKGWFTKKPADKTEKPEETPEVKAGETPEVKAGETPEVKAGETPEVKAGVNPLVVPDGNPETTVDKMKKITNINDFITEFGKLSGLSDDDSKAILAQFKELFDKLDDANKLVLAKNKDLDPKLLAIVRESYYINDDSGNKYQNVKLAELTAETASSLEVVRAHDIGNPRDVAQAAGRPKSTIVVNGQEIEVEIHDKIGAANIDAKYKYVREEGGELIFRSQKGDTVQEYVLQKDSNGKLHLIQYQYLDGYNEPDYKKAS